MKDKQSVRTVRLRTLYDCDELCQRTWSDDGDMTARAACRCSLPGFDHARWDPSANPGAAADAERLAGTLAHLAEQQRVHLDWNLDRDGCPRGWLESTFAASVAAYSTPRDKDSPLRMPSVRLQGRVFRDPEPPTRLLDWVRYLESIEDGAYAFFHEVCNSG